MSQTRLQVNQWLADLHPQLALDDQGGCIIACDDSLELELFVTETSSQFFLSTKVMDLTSQVGPRFLMEVMSLNLFMQETRGSALAVDLQAREIVLCYNQSLVDCDSTAFQNVIQNFRDTTKALRTRVTSIMREIGPENPLPAQGQPAPGAWNPNTPALPFDESNPLSLCAHLV